MSIDSSTKSASSLPCDMSRVDEFLSEPSDAVVASLASQAGPVLVLGAGGKMGLHLCLMLRKAFQRLRRDVPVIAVSRFSNLRDTAEFGEHGIVTVAGDLTSPAFLDSLPDAPLVFFMAGVKFGTSSSPELLQRMNVEMPALVARRFRRSRIVAFSTGCVYPFMPVSSRGANENTPAAPVGAYAESCLGRELAFSEASRLHGTEVLLLRLNYSVEFRYGVLLDIAQKVARREPVDLGMGHCNVIWQRDAVAHAILSKGLAAAPARPLNVTGPATLSVRSLARMFSDSLLVPVSFQGTESETAWLSDASLSHLLLGAPEVPLSTMVAWISAWIREGGSTWGKPTGFERRDGQF